MYMRDKVPTSYVNHAVTTAGGFPSAKLIHEKVRARPLDFDSEEESDVEDSPFARLGGQGSAHSKQSGSTPPKPPGGRPAPHYPYLIHTSELPRLH